MNAVVRASGLRVSYGERKVFEDVSVCLVAGRLIALVGPNGSGKSSLLRLLAGVQRPSAGVVERDGKVTLIAPNADPPSDLTPEDLALYGVALRQRPWVWGVPAEARERIAGALGRCGLLDQARAPVGTLSAGEVQRAWIAAALAAQSSAVLIDEPTSHLDLRYQVEVLRTLRSLSAHGVSVVVALHDLTLAARFADEIMLLASGHLQAGPPEAILSATALSAAYGISVTLHRHPEEGYLICLPG